MNTLRWKFIPILFCSLFSLGLQGSEPLIKTSYVKAKVGESLRFLLERRVGIPKKVLDEKGYLSKIKSWNPRIEDFDNLKRGEKVYVEIPYRTVLIPYEKRKKNKLANTKLRPIKKKVITRKLASSNEVSRVSKKSSDFFPKVKNEKDWRFSAFYTLSKGTFEENIIGTNISTVSNQDSPITLGGSAFKSISSEMNFSGSFYLSKIDSGISDRNEEVSIPFELGLTSYLGLRKSNWPIEVYSGLDIERFSSYNTDELPSGEALSTREHTITYFTAGVSKSFGWLGKKFLAKASISKSLLSLQSRESLVNPEKFSGLKYIAYLNMKYNDRWFYHGLFKQHSLTGATDLTITRFGLGVGYSF